MKSKTHPEYQTVEVACVCGNKFEVGSTMKGNIQVEICSNCHPFYTGKQKLVDEAGIVDKFNAKRKASAAHSGKKLSKAEKNKARSKKRQSMGHEKILETLKEQVKGNDETKAKKKAKK